MKKLLFSASAAAMAAALLVPMASFATYDRTYTALKATPVIDGEADECWDYAEWTDVDKPYDGSDKSDFDETLRIKCLWDEKYFYFYAQVHDLDVNDANDIVEVYLDEDNCRAGEYQDNDTQTRFQNDGTVLNGATTPIFKEDSISAVKMLDDGWIIEGAIPWFSDKKEGDVLGLEFMYNDGGEDADFITAFRWNVDTNGGDPAPWNNTEAWGTLILGGPVVIETEAPETEAQAPAETEAPAAAETAAPAADTAAPVAETAAPVAAAVAATTAAPQTGDMTALAAVAAFAVIGCAVIAKKH